jgi:hypothetical protein
MSPKDYKNTARPGTKPVPRRGSWTSFISGLSIGLLIALGVYFWSESLPPPAALIGGIGSDLEGAEQFDAPEVMSDSANILPRPTFDFYKILPEMEVPVPEWALADDDDEDEPGLAPGTYYKSVRSNNSRTPIVRKPAWLSVESALVSSVLSSTARTCGFGFMSDRSLMFRIFARCA